MDVRILAIVAVLGVPLCVAGCTWTVTRPTIKLPPPEPEPVEVAAAPASPPAPTEPEPPPPEPLEEQLPVVAPSIRIDEVSGATPGEAGARFSEVTEPLEHCGSGAGGTLRVRVNSDGVKTKFMVDPGSTVDPQTRECALEALAIGEVDEDLDHTLRPI